MGGEGERGESWKEGEEGFEGKGGGEVGEVERCERRGEERAQKGRSEGMARQREGCEGEWKDDRGVGGDDARTEDEGL